MGLGIYTIKRVVNRSPTPNSPEIKEVRKSSVVILYNYIRDGYIATFVDESFSCHLFAIMDGLLEERKHLPIEANAISA